MQRRKQGLHGSVSHYFESSYSAGHDDGYEGVMEVTVRADSALYDEIESVKRLCKIAAHPASV